MAQVTITNTLSKVISSGTVDMSVISPSGIPTPISPVNDYVNDMLTLTSGVLKFPAYNKVQDISIPYEGTLTFEVNDYKEIAYYKNLKLLGGTVEVAE